MYKWLFAAAILFSVNSNAQVKIGTPGSPHPKAVLELADTAKGFLLPSMTAVQMNNIATPPNGLLVFNTNAGSMYQFKSGINQWMPVMADSSEWLYDTGTARLYLRKALNRGDSIYYNTSSGKFLFLDNRLYRSTSGTSFNVDEGNSDKFVFKTTSSRFRKDPANNLSTAMWNIYEIDLDTSAVNNPFVKEYYGITNYSVSNQLATQKMSAIYGINNNTFHGGTDTAYTMIGLYNSYGYRNNAKSVEAYGILNNFGVTTATSGRVDYVYGLLNQFTVPSTSAFRVGFDYYGYFANASGGSLSSPQKVEGSAYHIYLGGMFLAGQGKNYAIYTNRGYNRFGDSTVISSTFGVTPRAIFDINSTGTMILPTGTTAQRPATGVTGMLRFNTDIGTPEAYTGAGGWTGLKNTVVASATVSLDPPNIFPNSFGTVTATVAGANVGNVVVINPSGAMTGNIAIAYARVSAANTIEVNFVNTSNTLTIDMTPLNFYVRVMQ